MLTKKEKELIIILNDTLPLEPRPFENIGNQVGMTEGEVLSKISEWVENGKIRRLGPAFRPQKVGVNANGMIAWNVKDNVIDKVGEKLATYKEVTHCYKRPSNKDWPYNLYTMIHGKNKDEVVKLVKNIAETLSIEDYKIIFSIKEFKKENVKYFCEQED